MMCRSRRPNYNIDRSIYDLEIRNNVESSSFFSSEVLSWEIFSTENVEFSSLTNVCNELFTRELRLRHFESFATLRKSGMNEDTWLDGTFA